MIVVQAMTNFVLKKETLVENRKGEDLLIFICCEQVYHNVVWLKRLTGDNCCGWKSPIAMTSERVVRTVSIRQCPA